MHSYSSHSPFGGRYSLAQCCNYYKKKFNATRLQVCWCLTFYSSTIAFNYILFLALEIYFSVSQKYLDGFKKRSYYFHAIAK